MTTTARKDIAAVPAVEPMRLTEMAPKAGLVPTSMTEAIQLAEMMANAKLVPAALQKSPADCLMVIQQALRWDLDPFAVAQECSVIQGKLMHSGKLVAAVVNSRGNLTQRLTFDYRGAGDDRTIIVSGQLRDEPQPRMVEVRLRDAKTNNGVWTRQPDQQLMYHGTRVWARRHTPELMLGVYSPEEFDEPPRRAPQAAPLTLNAPAPPPAEQPDAETGELVKVAEPHALVVENADWRTFGKALIDAIAADPSRAAEWLECNQTNGAAMKAVVPKMYERMMAAIDRAMEA